MISNSNLENAPEYIKRVVEEKDLLDEKIKKLSNFMDSEEYLKLSIEDTESKLLLQVQYRAMVLYSDALRDRIDLFLSRLPVKNN